MSSKKRIILVAILFILMAFSGLLFFGIDTDPKSNIQICSFMFALFAEIVIVANVLFLTSNEENNLFTIAGISSLTFIYGVINFIFNVLIQNVFKSLRSCLVFNISTVLIYLFIGLIIFLFKKGDK